MSKQESFLPVFAPWLDMVVLGCFLSKLFQQKKRHAACLSDLMNHIRPLCSDTPMRLYAYSTPLFAVESGFSTV